MSPSLKAFLALVFVAVVGAFLIQPILDATDTDIVATSPSETSEPPGQETEEPDTPEPSPEPEPTPTSSPSGGLIAGPFRTQPLFDRYPRSCLRSGVSEGTPEGIGVLRDGRVDFGSPDGSVSSGRSVGLRAFLGFNVSGALWSAIDRRDNVFIASAGVAGVDPARQKVRTLLWSPVSICGLAVRTDGALTTDSGSARLVAANVTAASFSPDGRRLALVLEEGNTTSVWIADLTSTNMREVQRERSGQRLSLKAWSADGSTLYLTSGRDGGLSFVGFTKTSAPPLSGGIVAAPVTGFEQCSGRLLGIVNGAVAEITRRGPDYLTDTDAGFTAVSCSPNGAFMAAVRADDLLLLNGDGSPVRDLTTDSGFRDVFVDWGPGGAGLIFGRVPEGGGEAQVWYIPEGGTARDTGLRYTPGPHAIDWAASPPTGLP